MKTVSAAISSHKHWWISPLNFGKRKCNSNASRIFLLNLRKVLPLPLQPERATHSTSRKQNMQMATVYCKTDSDWLQSFG